MYLELNYIIGRAEGESSDKEVLTVRKKKNRVWARLFQFKCFMWSP